MQELEWKTIHFLYIIWGCFLDSKRTTGKKKGNRQLFSVLESWPVSLLSLSLAKVYKNIRHPNSLKSQEVWVLRKKNNCQISIIIDHQWSSTQRRRVNMFVEQNTTCFTRGTSFFICDISCAESTYVHVIRKGLRTYPLWSFCDLCIAKHWCVGNPYIRMDEFSTEHESLSQNTVCKVTPEHMKLQSPSTTSESARTWYQINLSSAWAMAKKLIYVG